MKLPKNLNPTISNQQGAIAILIGIAMLTFISFAALAVDIGYILTTKNELQNIADATALASAGRLLEFYSNYQEISESSVKATANTAASMNWAGGESGGITIADSDIELGTWDWLNGVFNQGQTPPNATRTTAHRRDDYPNLAIPTFFAKLFGINSVDIQARAVAALPLTNEGGQDVPDIEKHPILVK